MYKDHPFDSARDIRKFMYMNYKVKVSYSLICAITNYQIKKYGCPLRSGNDVTSTLPDRPFKVKSFERRIKNKQRQRDDAVTKKIIRNAEKRLKNDKSND